MVCNRHYVFIRNNLQRSEIFGESCSLATALGNSEAERVDSLPLWEPPVLWLRSSAIMKETLALARFELGFETRMSFGKAQIFSTDRF